MSERRSAKSDRRRARSSWSAASLIERLSQRALLVLSRAGAYCEGMTGVAEVYYTKAQNR